MSKKRKFKLFEWAKEHAPKALDIVGEVTGLRALNRLSDVISHDNPDNVSPKELARVKELKELDLRELEIVLEDVANARNREVELAKTGKNDFMMHASGIVGLGAFLLMVIAVIFIPGVSDNVLIHQLMGIVEGVALTIFGYYYGTSKSSSDKTKLLTK